MKVTLRCHADVVQQVDAFRPNIPIIVGLRNSGMRDRHWADLSAEIGFTLRPDDKFTLMNVLEQDLHMHLDVIKKVGERAAKEFHIEQQLDKMSTEWNDVMLDIEPYRCVRGTGKRHCVRCVWHVRE